jgi:cytochrome c-type biogenesis protein CcmH/NrfG
LIKNRSSFLTFVTLVFGFQQSYAITPPVCKQEYSKNIIKSRNDEAKLLSALKKDPNNVECLISLASLYLKRDKVSHGFDLVSKAYKIDPAYVQSKNISKILDLALRLTKLKQLALKNGDSSLYNELGDTYYDMGIFKDAKSAYKKSLELNPNQSDIKILLALCLGNEDKMKEAAKILRDVLDRDPFNFYANYYYAKILKNELDRQEDAKAYFLASKFILKELDPKFKTSQEREFIKKDLADELSK